MRRNRLYRDIGDLPRTVPVFPLARALVLPGLQLPLNIFEPRYLAMIDDSIGRDRVIGMIQPHEDQPAGAIALRAGDQKRPELYKVGCVARLISFRETGDGRYLIVLDGICRFRLADELPVTTLYRQVVADYKEFAADLGVASAMDIDRAQLLHHLKRYLEHQSLNADWKAIENTATEALVNSLTLSCPFEISEKQALLEAPTTAGRAQILLTLIQMAAAGPGEPPETQLQ